MDSKLFECPVFLQKDFALTLISQPVSVRAISIDAFLLCFQVQIVVELSCTGRCLLQQLFYPLEYRHFESPIKEQTFFFFWGDRGVRSTLIAFVPHAPPVVSPMCSPSSGPCFSTPTARDYMLVSAQQASKVEAIHLESGHC